MSRNKSIKKFKSEMRRLKSDIKKKTRELNSLVKQLLGQPETPKKKYKVLKIIAKIFVAQYALGTAIAAYRQFSYHYEYTREDRALEKMYRQNRRDLKKSGFQEYRGPEIKGSLMPPR